jgi:predicted dehydrogenase
MAKKKSAIGIGLVGLGFMGLTHLRAARQVRGARLVAIATSDPRKARGDFSGVRGNFGAAGGRESLDGIRVHPTLEALLADPAVELVDICLPSYLHAGAALLAFEAGKHVLVEKPIALQLADAERMLAASRRARKLLLVAQVLRFFPEFAFLSDSVRKGSLGRLLSVNLRRVIATPSWGDSWFSDPARSGGMVVDLHIHDTDFIVQLFGKPRSVTSHGVVEGERVDFIRTAYQFGAPAPLVSAEAGWINAPSLAFEHGYEAFFEKATLRFNSSDAPRPRLYGKKGVKELAVPAADAFQLEIGAAVESVRTGKAHPLLDAASARTSLEVCLAEQNSARSGKPVAVKR